VLLLGSSPGAPRAQAGQNLSLSSPALGRLSLRLVAEEALA
jgi:hypothetical protein